MQDVLAGKFNIKGNEMKHLNGIPTNGRDENEIREQYEIEKDLASRLMDTPRNSRSQAYVELYNELFRRIPHHSQLVDRKGGHWLSFAGI
jgi:hypothetical protein